MEDLSDSLRKKGLRNTSQRRAVLAALHGFPHSTASDVEARVGAAETSAGMSRQGLYNVLEDLTGAGLIRRIEPAGSPTRYELRGRQPPPPRLPPVRSHRRRRLRDRRRPLPQTGRADGLTIEEAEITWWGLCVRCQREAPQ
ncbi:Fur family transcriptional regulator [Streptomyces niveus]|uniref:Fur family transcriptional regulator n=1 Tax=Streptomyces niveus TaxID=193462 RepID=UPI0038669D19